MIRHDGTLGPVLRAAGIGALLVSLVAGAGPASSWQSLVSPELLALYRSAATSKAASATSPTTTSPPTLSALAPRLDSKGRVQVDVLFDCSLSAPTQALTAAGLAVNASIKVPPMCVVEGWIVPKGLPNLASIASVKKIVAPSYSSHSIPKPHPGAQIQAAQPRVLALSQNQPQAATGPAIDGTAVSFMRADQFVTQTGTNGAGITVGVLSDNVSSLALIQARGELPAVQVVAPSPGGTPSTTPGDEGTMMLEEIYAVAPGANLAFCGPNTTTEYVGCVGQLIAAGATIIVDDQAYVFDDLMSSSSPFAQAVQSTLAQNPTVALFTVTENYNGSYWEGPYAPTALASLGYGPLTCSANGQVDYYINSFNGAVGDTLTVNTAKTYALTFQWADPFGQNASNFDFYWVNSSTNATGCVSASGSTNTFIGGNATPLAAGTYYVYVATPDASLAGKFMKFFVGGDGDTALSIFTSGSVVSPQAFVPGVITVGAVNGSDGIGNTIESYSGLGPINLVYPTPTQVQAPWFVAPDAVYVDASGTNFTTWPDGNFHGTSAAAPNAAAVAALIRGAFPSLTPAQLTSALQTGATQLGNTVPDGVFGYGRVDAIGALGALPYPTLSAWPNSITIVGGSSSPAYPFTVSGVGNLHFSVQSDPAALLPASLVAAGTAGVTISPASCGAPTTACTISFTPALGTTGNVSVNVLVADGANRTALTGNNITVIAPPPPTIKVTSGGSQSFTAGGSASTVAFTVAGTGPLTVSAVSGNTGVLPTSGVSVTSGCGTSALSCSAGLTVASGQSGSSTLTITVQDPYGQKAMGTATVQVNAAPTPSKGGGGALDVFMLVSLGGFAFLRRARAARSLVH
jgi:Subtilase family